MVSKPEQEQQPPPPPPPRYKVEKEEVKDEPSSTSRSSYDASSSYSWPNTRPPRYRGKDDDEGMKLWGILLFGFIGATVTTFAVGHLRRTADWFCSQMARSNPTWKDTTGNPFRSNFKEEARRRYQRRMQEEHEEEMERVERIRRMQSVFNRERDKYKRSYQNWREHDRGQYSQHFEREDWYWKTDNSYKDQKADSRTTHPRKTGTFMLSHHYSVLGLDRWRTQPYTEEEIKKAFRTKAKEFHPDQNQENKEVAEAKFKEVMSSYEAIKVERKNGQC